MSQAASQPPGIFICYRRDDSGGYARALYERLSAHFGDGQIFMDLDRIEPGEDFVQVIEEAVGSCGIMLALIGRNWLTSSDEGGRKLDNPHDFVRLEATAALARGIGVIPVLVQGARMPRPQDLPEDIRPLSRRNALELSDRWWRQDVERLVETLEKALAPPAPPPQPAPPITPVVTAPEIHLTTLPEPSPPSATAPPAAGTGAAGVAPAAGRSNRSCTVVVIYAAVAALLLAGLGIWYKLAPNATLVPPDPAGSPTPTATPGVTQAPPGMVYVPGGEFEMGSEHGDAYERPAHRVTVKPFFIDRYEVTNDEYEKFVKATARRPPQGWKGRTYAQGTARHPVTGVTWDDAVAYAGWADKRLPTEAEWEFAARGTDGRRYPWGNEWRAGMANAHGGRAGLADVGYYKGASPFGAYDLIGNAWEWTADSIHSYRGGSIPEDAFPAKDRESLKVLRGGCYLSGPDSASATYRRGWPSKGSDYAQTGFRCAQDVKE
ncbi:MAG TPA: SUMF1/EgtB/PvdO family nonheme iron enzyme [Pyrinomonadaceae bacterium]|jgi:formylglycine-generating enzyme required for sulfatase activity